MHNLERVDKVDIKSLLLNGTEVTATAAQLNSAASSGVANAVAGAAAGYKIARGVTAITGTGTVAHGLTTVVAVLATLKDDISINGNEVSAAFTGTTVTLKVWKPTSSADCTPIAATAAKNVSWLVIGT
jgi:hypothetical protein